MFSDDKNLEQAERLVEEIKSYLTLQKRYAQLELTEKLSILLSMIIMLIIVILLGVVALFYFSFAMAYVLEPLVGGLKTGLLIIAMFNLLLILGVLLFRKRLIINPMVRFLAKLFLKKEE
ncbi:MAG: phage holin family protein [Bacteroidia bacterium]|nr:phage holin family protein [Bacteroidia bacterium]